MARTKRSKPSRETSAAYAVSQPLFDALRGAVARVDEQKKQLILARDIAQGLHVKLAADGQPEHRAGHVQYVNAIVQASKMTSRTFADIYTELAKITAAEPHEGKSERQGHQEFVALGIMADEAEEKAEAYLSSAEVEEQRVAFSSTSLADQVDDEVEMKDAEESEDDEVEKAAADAKNITQAVQDGQRPGKGPKLGKRGDKIHGVKEGKDPNVPFDTLGSHSKKALNAEKRRQNRVRRREKRNQLKRDLTDAQKPAGASTQNRDQSTRQSAHDETSMHLDGGGPASFGAAQPTVQYEDVSVEVDTRLKAKEEARESKKRQKKRKRESGDSFDGAVAAVIEEPTTKKPKSIFTNGANEQQASKKHSRLAEEGGDGGKRKRKKTKAELASRTGSQTQSIAITAGSNQRID